MRFTTFFTAAIAALLVDAKPTLLKRDVVAPQITSPDASTVWTVGKTETVTWDTSNLPAQITNPTGIIYLGFLNDTSGNEHLDIDNPLATGFNITLGSVNVVVPSVADGSDYIIALVGDSGNISPKFTITGGSSSAASSAPSTSSTVVGTGIVIASGSSTSGLATVSTPSATSPAATTASGPGPVSVSTAPTVSATLVSGSASGTTASGSGSTAAPSTTGSTSGALSRFGSGALLAQIGGALVAVCLFV